MFYLDSIPLLLLLEKFEIYLNNFGMKNYVMDRADLRIRLKLPQEVIQDDLAAAVQLGTTSF